MAPCGLCGEDLSVCLCVSDEDDYVIQGARDYKLWYSDLKDKNPGWWTWPIMQGGGNTTL